MPLLSGWQAPWLLQFIGHWYLLMVRVYLQEAWSSPPTPTYHSPAQQVWLLLSDTSLALPS